MIISTYYAHSVVESTPEKFDFELFKAKPNLIFMYSYTHKQNSHKKFVNKLFKFVRTHSHTIRFRSNMFSSKSSAFD